MATNAITAGARDALDVVRNSLERLFRTDGWELPVLPDVAARVLSLAEDPDSDAAELAKLIQRDPSLSGHILRIANSPLYAPRSRIISLQQAVAWMGLFEISEIAFSVAIRAKIFNVPGQEGCVEALWKHAYATANWCKEIAVIKRMGGDTAYLCGLLHQIGIPIVLQSVADILQAQRLKLTAAEFETLADDYHVAVAGDAVSKWGLPNAVPAVIAHWSNFGAGRGYRKEAAMVGLAHALAHATLNGQTSQVAEYRHSPAAAELRMSTALLEQLLGRQEAVRTAVQSV